MLRSRSAILVTLLVVAGCSGTAPTTGGQQPNDNGGGGAPTDAAPNDTAQPISGSNLELTPAAKVTFSGKTDKKTKSFAVGSPLEVQYTYKGSGNFIVDLNGTDGSTIGNVSNRIGSGSLTTWVYGGSGDGYFDVISDGSWTITATAALPSTARLPATFKGNTDVTTVPFILGSQATVKWTYKGSSNFIVDVIDPTTGAQLDNVANLIGSSTDSTQLYGDDGLAAFSVEADGSWTLTVSSP